MMDDFATAEIETGGTSIFVRSHGSGAPVLLLHGFPQTHLMWRDVAAPLARNFTVVCADLRVRPQRLPGVGSEPCALCEARHGARHGQRHGAARISALLGGRT